MKFMPIANRAVTTGSGTLASVFTIISLLPSPVLAAQPSVIEHVLVYKETGRYGGWPANHGIWNWGNEILCGFSAAYYLKKSPNVHQYDSSKPEEPRLARSLDGGHTWAIESPPSLLPPSQGGKAAVPITNPIDFQTPGFAMTLRFTDTNKGPSLLFYSYDRGKSWQGPFDFPLLGQTGIAARTDYIVNGKHDAFVFLTAAKSNGKEGRPFCARTTDGGLHWNLVSWMADEPPGFAIMPSTVRLSPDRLISAMRIHEGDKDWIDLFESHDNAGTWKYLTRPITSTGGHGGNPPSMIRLKDGRICVTYGFRSEPYEIRAKLSSDEGKTWSNDIVLDNGATWEVGYTRTAQRPDGKIVSLYYASQAIAATIWDP
jgi:hypothetical protein